MSRKQWITTVLCASFMVTGCAAIHKEKTKSAAHPACDTACHANQRRQAYIAQNPQLSDDVKHAILQGRVLIGMTKEDVIAAIGQPDQQQKTSTWAAREQWIYYAGTDQARFYIFQFGKVNSWSR